jgi:hypothetical protein
MKAGYVRREGESVQKLSDDVLQKEKKDDQETTKDSFGNEIKIEKEIVWTKKSLKDEIKNTKKQISEGKKKKTLSEDEIFDLEYKLESLTTQYAEC